MTVLSKTSLAKAFSFYISYSCRLATEKYAVKKRVSEVVYVIQYTILYIMYRKINLFHSFNFRISVLFGQVDANAQMRTHTRVATTRSSCIAYIVRKKLIKDKRLGTFNASRLRAVANL